MVAELRILVHDGRLGSLRNKSLPRSNPSGAVSSAA
jgi:hypothetical protein